MPFGKIDTLPADLRNEINARLDDGQTGAEILPWLNDLPAVKAHLQKKFSGAAITDQNLSNWRLGGYQTHTERREKSLRARELADYARTLGVSSADILSGGSAIAGGMILETLENLDSTQQTALLIEKPENLPAFLNAMARLPFASTARAFPIGIAAVKPLGGLTAQGSGYSSPGRSFERQGLLGNPIALDDWIIRERLPPAPPQA